MRNNKQKVITIAALVIAVIGLSIGFAAFASTLNISTSASVTPADGNFIVKFSKVNNELNEEDVTPSTGTGDAADIDNTNASNPKIGTLSTTFTQPGQSVEYTFYVRNMGKYDAYLTNIRFNNASTGNSFKVCTATSDNPVSNANDMCQYITYRLTLEDSPSNKVLTSTSDFATTVGNSYYVAKSADPTTGTTNSKMVKVTITYEDGSPFADGAFTVDFGSVEMVFASLQGYVPPVATSEAATGDTCTVVNHKSFGNSCVLSQDTGTSGISTGDKITCGTESFYVIETPSNGITKMLAEWNLNISEPGDMPGVGVPYSYTYCESTVGYQDNHVRGFLDIENDSSLTQYMYSLSIPEMNITDYSWPYGMVKFDRVTKGNYGYWTTGENHDLNTSVYTQNNNGGYPAYVYNSNATLKTFVDNYVGYLNSVLSTNATGRLISYEELEALGCSGSNHTCSDSPATAPSWVYQTSYWSGSAFDSLRDVWDVRSIGHFGSDSFREYGYSGVRPVIDIPSSAISTS